MNTLNTRKIICVLIGLVLAFGVQGIADALTFSTSRSGDLATELPTPNDFDIRFSVSLKGNTSIKDANGNLVDEDDNRIDSSGYFIAGDPLVRTPVGGEDKPTDAKRYHYNQEQVTITVTNATITEVGRHDIADAASHVLMETGKDGTKLSSSITLTLEAAAAEVVGITIADTTPAEDLPNGAADRAPSITFTVYVVPGTSTAALTLTGTGTDGVETGNDFGSTRIDGLFNAAADVPLTYEVTGSGRVFVQASEERKTRETNKLETSSSAPVYLKMNRSSNKVTVWVRGTDAKRASQSVTFINTYADPQITGGDNQPGATGGRLPDPLEVTVKDANNRVIPGGVVVGFASTAANSMFIPVVGTTVYVSTADALVTTAPATPDALTTTATSTVPGPNEAIFVKTDSRGIAQTYFELGDTAGSQRVTITVNGQTYANTFFRATATNVVAGDAAKIEIESGNGQRAAVDEPLEDPLVVIVKDIGGRIVAGAPVTFTTSSGELSPPEFSDPGTYTASDAHSDRFIVVNTDENGKASVRYNVGDLPGAKEVFAGITRNGRAITKIFNVNGRATATRDDPVDDDDDDDTPTVTVRVPTSVYGTAGSTATLRVTAAANAIVSAFALGNTFPRENVGSFTRSGTIHSSILTLPDQVANYSLTVFVDGVSHPVTVRVSQPTRQAQGRLDIETDVSGGPGESKPVRITAIDADGTGAADVTVRLRITAGGGSFSPASVTTGDDGTATSTFTRGSTAGSNYFITATTTPTGYDTADSRGVRITITAGTATPPPADTSVPTAGEAAAIDVYDGDGQRGIPNARLSELLVVEVTDANGTPVSGERVTFRTTIGSGRFSPARPRTNGGGRAQTWFTPTSSGTLRIAASVEGVSARAVFRVTTGAPPASLTKVSGDSQGGTPGDALANAFVVEVKDADGETIEGVPVAFSVTAGGGRLSATSATTDRDGRAETTLTLGSRVGVNSVQARVSGVDPVTFNTSIEPEILVAAANRPVMYWIDGGALYRLAGAKATQIAASANGIAVGGGKVYWTATTGASAGTINAANLDGSGAKVLTRIMAVPMGIAVDTADSKLYWTNARGRIQSANLDGSGIRNVQQNLSNPTDLAVSNGFIYWTENATAIKRVNLKGQKQVQDVATNLDTVGGLAVGGGKVYWTEQTSASAGTVNGANLNGTQFETLATLLSAPMGIDVDTTGSKLYWTNARGRIQSANLDGSGIRNVVKGLIAPSQLRTAGANTDEPVAKQSDQLGKKDTSAYDVNGDGKVDNVDASLVASGLDTGNAKYDVNKDGTVNFLDLLLIFDNRDDGAAGAPTVVGMQLTALQRDRIEAQIDLLIATNDRSAAAMRTLVYLQQLLVTARPEKTQLLANYPNPFNPETWMPYELATDTDVRITIYNAQGVVIRTLHLGQQSAGYYTDRERAAYWDGRNAFGEQVASGVYFYQLETDEMSSLRKMVILK